MNAAPSQSLINLLLESGVASTEEAAQLATNLNGGSWVSQVLDSGKVDEQRFLAAIGNFFRVPVVSIDAKKIDRATLSILPSRFVFQHHILPIEAKENSVVLATYDLFNSIGRQLAGQLFRNASGTAIEEMAIACPNRVLANRQHQIRPIYASNVTKPLSPTQPHQRHSVAYNQGSSIQGSSECRI